jgi:hypothetical protein
MRTPRTPPPSRRRVIQLGIIAVAFALLLAVFDAPGVENIVSPLDTDSAEAGRQYKYQCELPGDIGPEGIEHRFGIGKWQNTIHAAKLSAVKGALARGWKASLSDGEWSITGPDGFGYETAEANVKCKQIDKRTVKDKKRR